MADQRTLTTRLEAQNDAYDKAMKKSADETRRLGVQGDQTAKQLGASWSNVGKDMTRTVTPAAAGIAFTLKAMSNDYNSAADSIRSKTGATGKAFDELEGVMKRVGSSVPISLGAAGDIVAELTQRTELQGEALEQVARRLAQLDFLGQSVDVATLTKFYGNWRIATNDQAAALDELFRVSQITGISTSNLLTSLTSGGGQLRDLGLSFSDAALLMGNFERAGIGSETVMRGLRTAIAKFATEGRAPQQALADLFDSIKNAKDPTEALSIAIEYFGQRSAGALVRAVRDGTFSLEDLRRQLQENNSTIDSAADANTHFGDTMKMAYNSVAGFVGPAAEVGAIVATIAAGAGPAAMGMGKLAGVAEGLGSKLGVASSQGAAMAAGFGAMGAGAIAAAGIVSLLAFAVADVQQQNARHAEGVEAFRKALESQTAAVEDNIRVTASQRLAASEAGRTLLDVGADMDVFTTGIRENGEQLEEWSGLAGSNVAEDLGKMTTRIMTAAEGGNAFAQELMSMKDGMRDDNEWRNLIQSLDGVSDEFDEAALAAQIYDSAVQTVTASTAENLGMSADLIDQWTEKLNLDPAELGVDELTDQVSQAAAAARSGQPGVEALAGAIRVFSDDTATATEKATAYKTALDSMFGGAISAFDAWTQYEGAVDKLTQSFIDNGLALEGDTEASRNNRQALSGMAQAALADAEARYSQTGSITDANIALGGHVQQLKDVMIQAGLTEEQAQGYIDTLGLTPQNLLTMLSLNKDNAQTGIEYVLGPFGYQAVEKGAHGAITVDTWQATVDMNNWIRQYGNLTPIEVQVNFRQRLIDMQAPAGAPTGNWWAGADGDPNTPWPRAAGGPLMPMSVYRITEPGADFETAQIGSNHYLFTGNKAGYMTPASPGVGSGGGTTVINRTTNVSVTAPLMWDPADHRRLAKALAPDIGREIARNEGSVSR